MARADLTESLSGPLPARSHRSHSPDRTAGFMMIPYRHQTGGPDDLPADYQLLLTTVTDADRALICKDICRAAGLSTEPGPVEGTRAKLNRLAERGWLRKTATGSFARMS